MLNEVPAPLVWATAAKLMERAAAATAANIVTRMFVTLMVGSHVSHQGEQRQSSGPCSGDEWLLLGILEGA